MSGANLSEPDRFALIPRELREATRAFALEAKSANTRRAYAADWRKFQEWARATGIAALPVAPEHLAIYLAHLATDGRGPGRPVKASTISRALAGIAAAHLLSGHPSPRPDVHVQEVWKGIRARLGTRRTEATPLLPHEIREALKRLPEGIRSARDRALLLVGCAGAFRRSELVALDVSDLTFTEHGVEAFKRRSKTDQAGEGRKVWIPWGSTPDTCPVRALKAWLAQAEIAAGAVFRPLEGPGDNDQVVARRLTSRCVARVVKRAAKLLGRDPKAYKGHSLRAGFVTGATIAGKSEAAIMRQTGHASPLMVRRYLREVDGWRDNAAAGLF